MVLELDLLCNTVARALELTHTGHHASGYWELVYGRDRSLAYADEAWGLELTWRWEMAVRRYVREWAPRN